MTKIALTAAALLVATASAFAHGSDNYGSYNANQPVANQSSSQSIFSIDNSHTGSIAKSLKAQGDANANVPAPSGQGIWGH
ncbi:hypothetical protein ASD99_22025 [Mesorhizobium sp. Root695]|jgi:hypothetical protein|uniref:DUF680 domain-containing protein n=1 Tax=unclassified Mesorhizobium TaxID=325217 RepID=UPI0006FAF9E4|nr:MULTISPECIES: DUF680 domain-containing protein [unclassified Mesorhizobium]KQU91337.1 hypothetical protein ASD12_26700 [Mesorhizobium sp. Root102]KRB30572.1 hypothetical protein ASD99_22025 [Mesorhizobium sp. Root695]